MKFILLSLLLSTSAFAKFGTDGVSYFTSIQAFTSNIVLGKNEEIYSNGCSTSPTGFTTFYVHKISAEGIVDSNFGDKGTLTVNRKHYSLSSMSLNSDQSLMLTGSHYTGGDDDLVVLKYDTKGQPDKAFSKNGELRIDFNINSDERGAQTVELSNGNHLLFGYSRHNLDNFKIMMLQADPKGQLVKSYGIKTIAEIDSDFTIDQVIKLSDSKFLLAVQKFVKAVPDVVALLKIDINGNRDMSFGVKGYLELQSKKDAYCTLGGAKEDSAKNFWMAKKCYINPQLSSKNPDAELTIYKISPDGKAEVKWLSKEDYTFLGFSKNLDWFVHTKSDRVNKGPWVTHILGFDSKGAPLNSFGNKGVADVIVKNSEKYSDFFIIPATLDSQDRILVSGIFRYKSAEGLSQQIPAILRILPNGKLDE